MVVRRQVAKEHILRQNTLKYMHVYVNLSGVGMNRYEQLLLGWTRIVGTVQRTVQMAVLIPTYILSKIKIIYTVSKIWDNVFCLECASSSANFATGA